MDEGLHDVREHHPVGDPAAVAAPRVGPIGLRTLREQSCELVPHCFQQRCWDSRHGSSGGYEA